jgi:transcriptional regulator with XRE-family HTH domain
MSSTIGSRVQAARRARGMTSRQLAAAAEVVFETVSRIENDRNSPTIDTLLRIARALDWPVNELIEDKPAGTPESTPTPS